MQPGFSRIVRVMKSLNFRSESSSLNMSLPIISFRATQLNVLALLKNLRNHILISVPFRTRMLELFSELLLVFTWSKEPSSLQKSTASMVLPPQRICQEMGFTILFRIQWQAVETAWQKIPDKTRSRRKINSPNPKRRYRRQFRRYS